EVIVDFLEGDPDQPIIVGSVYNADTMPPLKLPERKMVSGLKSHSTPGGGGYNELTFDDTKGNEKITIHGQHDLNTTVEHDEKHTVKNDRTIHVTGKHTETVDKDTKVTINGDKYQHDVTKGTATYHVQDALTEKYDGGQETTVTGGQTTKVSKGKGKNGITILCTDSFIHINAAQEILLSAGPVDAPLASLLLKSDGTVEIVGKKELKTEAPKTMVQGDSVDVNGRKEAKLFTGDQTVATNGTTVGVCGAKIVSCASDNSDTTGTPVKIN